MGREHRAGGGSFCTLHSLSAPIGRENGSSPSGPYCTLECLLLLDFPRGEKKIPDLCEWDVLEAWLVAVRSWVFLKGDDWAVTVMKSNGCRTARCEDARGVS